MAVDSAGRGADAVAGSGAGIATGACDAAGGVHAEASNASANGGTSPRMARPTTMLPDQNSVVRMSSR